MSRSDADWQVEERSAAAFPTSDWPAGFDDFWISDWPLKTKEGWRWLDKLRRPIARVSMPQGCVQVGVLHGVTPKIRVVASLTERMRKG